MLVSYQNMWSNVLQQFKNMTRNMNTNLLGQSRIGREEPVAETEEKAGTETEETV